MAPEFARCCALWAEATAYRARQAHELDGMPARTLHQALSGMSPDTDIAARVIVQTPSGELVGATSMSLADVERLRLAAEDGATMHGASDVAAEAEAFLRGEGGA